MKKVFISTSNFGQFSQKPLELLKSKGFDVSLNQLGRKLAEDETIEAISDTDAVLAGTEVYNQHVLDRVKKLKVISRVGVGLDSIDLPYAENRGIKVLRTKTSPALAVAELSLGLILDLLRKISFQNQQTKKGVWKKQMGSLLNGKTLGIIGLGTIGKTLVEITKGFRLNYLACDLHQDDEFAKSCKVEYCDLDTLLSRSDVISIHLNLTDQNHGLIDFEHLKKIKPHAILINTSRGQVINEDDLERALKEKVLAGAGLDVFKQEPYKGPLLNFDNVIVTPHIASYAKEIRVKMEMEAAVNLIKGLKSG